MKYLWQRDDNGVIHISQGEALGNALKLPLRAYGRPRFASRMH
jgi:hypothetical protein